MARFLRAAAWGTSVFSVATLTIDSPRRLFGIGLFTALLNPKIAVMYVSLIPQFESPAAGDVALRGFALGGAQICVSLTVNLRGRGGGFAPRAARPHADCTW